MSLIEQILRLMVGREVELVYEKNKNHENHGVIGILCHHDGPIYRVIADDGTIAEFNEINVSSVGEWFINMR